MSFDQDMRAPIALPPLDIDHYGQHLGRDTSLRHKRSLKNLFSKSPSSRVRGPSPIFSPEFPPSVIASQAVTSDGPVEQPATSKLYSDTPHNENGAAVAAEVEAQRARNGQTRQPIQPKTRAVSGADKSPPKKFHYHTRTASSEWVLPRHGHSRSTSVDAFVPRTPQRTPSHPRAAKDDDVASEVVRELHQHARNLSAGSMPNNAEPVPALPREPHARTLSGSSVVLGSDGKPALDSRTLTPRNSATPQSQRMRNFSRPSAEHRRVPSTEHKRAPSADESRPSFDRPQPRTARYTTRPPVSGPPLSGPPLASIRRKQSYDTVVQRKHSQTHDTILEGSTGTLPPRPSTSCSELRPRPSTSHEQTRPQISVKLPRNRAAEGSPEVEQVTWKTPAAENEVRDSMRSGWSAWSNPSTKHSSVFTKMSSVRDSTTTAELSDNEPSRVPHHTEDGPTLYSRTIKEEPRDAHHIRMSFLMGGDIDLRSSRIAAAMNDTIGPDAALREPTPESPDPADTTAAEHAQTVFARPPQLREPSASHDQYGFRKATRDVTEAEYNAWHREYSKAQNRRTSRWVSMMKGAGLATNEPTRFPFRSEKVQRFVRKGVPPAWRGALWFFYAGGQSYVDKFPGLYAKLVAESEGPQLSSNDKEAIDRDINRTFPDNIHFKPEPALPEGQEAPLLVSLRRLLYAFAMHHAKIGYCQSLNFLAGMLLLFLDEEKAFWMLHIITARYLPGTHEISLEGANVDLWVLMMAVREEQPKVWAKIGGEPGPAAPTRLPPVSLCTTPWFMSLFIGTLPAESALRVWDMMFYDGSTAVFRAALAIFRMGDAEILRVQDPMEIFQVVQTLPRRMLDASALATAANRKGCVSSIWIEQRRRDRRQFYAEERAAEKARKQSGEAAARAPADGAVMGTAAAARSAGDLTRQRSRGVLVKRPPSRKR